MPGVFNPGNTYFWCQYTHKDAALEANRQADISQGMWAAIGSINIKAKLATIRKNFDRVYWKEDGYRSGKTIDERANAMAVSRYAAGVTHTGHPGPERTLRL